jgi:adenylyltransferase/sulfurtransferase
MSFRIEHEPIRGPLLGDNTSAGAIVVFEGLVRNLNEGKPVQALEYEAFDEMAVLEGEKILAEARKRFGLIALACSHRVGLLRLGEVAIRIEASGGHRREAFEAAEWVVDEVKRRVPIWKKEHYDDGPSEWLNAGGQYVITPESFYARQERLEEVDQAKLSQASVLVVGAGGLGCPAILYLAGAGVGRIGIIDGDTVEPSNLHRQPLYRASDSGRPKARLAAERARSLNPFVQVEAFSARFDAQNADLIESFDIVLDCTDNFATKFLLNDLCVSLGKPLVVASIHKFEGQLLVVQPGRPCLRCLWPEAPVDGCVGTCADDGVLGYVPGVFGTLQAGEALKLLLDIPITPGLTVLDLKELSLEHLHFPRNASCPACNGRPIETEDVVSRLRPGDLLVDIREPDEWARYPIEGAFHMSMSAFNPTDARFETERVVLVCEHGVRSRYLADALKRAGFRQFTSWHGGRREILQARR